MIYAGLRWNELDHVGTVPRVARRIPHVPGAGAQVDQNPNILQPGKRCVIGFAEAEAYEGRLAGALVGLRVSHTRGHIIRAILEGVAFSLRDTLTIFRELSIPYDAIRLGGAGASSPLWRQIQADVYGRNVLIPAAKEGAAYGAAILAGVAAGWWNTVDQACDALDVVSAPTPPNPGALRILEARYQLYRRIYPALRNIFQY